MRIFAWAIVQVREFPRAWECSTAAVALGGATMRRSQRPGNLARAAPPHT